MTDKELARLGKADLIEIIYQLKKNESYLLNKLDEANIELESRDIKVSKTGSIAEAALTLNNVFETAQKAADDYLNQVYSKYSGAEERCNRMIAETEELCRRREQETDAQINAKWALFNAKVQEYIQTKSELSNLMK